MRKPTPLDARDLDAPRVVSASTSSRYVVDATLLAAQAPHASGSVLNIGCGASYSVLDLIAAVEKATGRPLEPLFGPARAGDVKHSFANIDRARARIGY